MTQATLDEDGRRAAIAQSVPLLATYFSSAETWDLTTQPAVADGNDEIDAELAAAVRLRVMLALGQQLLVLAAAIAAQPTFCYAQRRRQSAGLLAGRLDVARYARRSARRAAPKAYPVRTVERDHLTPENALALAALRAISRLLATVPTQMLPRRGGPERRHLEALRSDLLRSERTLIGALGYPAGRLPPQTRGPQPLAALCARVARRIGRGDLRDVGAYGQLIGWVQAFLSGAHAEPSDRHWAFYDERFDTRLFEIWTLAVLTSSLTERYGSPQGGKLAPLWRRRAGGLGIWATPQGQIELFFQRDTATIDLPGRWSSPSHVRELRVLPDVTLRVTRRGKQPSWLLLDCKLRRHPPIAPAHLTASEAERRTQPSGARQERSGGVELPTEELYKLLGYFDHLLGGEAPFGALVYYTPGGSGVLRLTAETPPERAGEVLLVGVDPSDEAGAAQALSIVCDCVAALLA